jgi:uncharacterized damage-inducible protein DinB
LKLTEWILADLERETPLTRRALERVPEARYDWKPHEKSMPLGHLARLVATMPDWIATMVERDELDVAPGAAGGYRPPELRTKRELLDAFDTATANARAALQGATDAHLMTNWKLLAGGRVVQEQARHAAIREGVFLHLAHHRGQLTVYLRLAGAPVPAIYGPSADERIF